MPDRVIRDELLESERWLGLKDNADRLAYIALLLRADSLGNFNAEPFRLMRLWRDFGINTPALVAKTLAELSDHDLVRLYSSDTKPFLHVPRFNQRTRYIKRVFPPSPWTTIEQKQLIADNSPDSSQAVTGRSQQKGSEVKGSEEKRKRTKAVAQAPFVLPDWIPKDDWNAWVEARAKARKTPTRYAMELAVRKLDNYRQQGHPPEQVLMQAAFNGWVGLYPPKEIT